MSSQPTESNAEQRFREAFIRLKNSESKILALGTPVTQNNVAREAGTDPSALKKSRFPALIREIQAYIELNPVGDSPVKKKAKRRRASNRSLQERLDDAILQRDEVQSILTSANRRIVELIGEIRSLEIELDRLRPPPTRL